jgi:class 3 adenylate cyclase
MGIKSLRQRLFVFILLPIALILFITGFVGFMFAKETMLNQWRETAILRLQRAAHHLDMRLSRPIEWMDMFHRTDGYRGSDAIQEWILDRLRHVEGVTGVDLEWGDDSEKTMPMMGRKLHMNGKGAMRFKRAKISEVTPPRYDAQAKETTVSLISDFNDESGKMVGRLKVSLSFAHLMQDIKERGWWQSDLACLVDRNGRYLAHTEPWMKARNKLGEKDDPLELAMLRDMKEKQFGTVLGRGHPPDKVGGFYAISQVPWVILLFAPGEEILAPIVRFRFYYVLAGGLCVFVVLFFIRLVGGNIVGRIREISDAANMVAKGHYGKLLSIGRTDEIGVLAENFNTMVDGLKDRDFISNTFGRYVDQQIARELMKRPEATRLGGEKRQVAILMSDLRGFTHLSESLTPEATITVLNHYFSHMIEVIQKRGGIIVDFYGDGVLAFFDPLEGPVEPSVHSSIRCAFEMQESMKVFNSEMRSEDLPELQMSIGVNVGRVVVGNVGSEARAKYGIVGSAVNITQRIQAAGKGGNVVVSEPAYKYMSQKLIVQEVVRTQLKGLEGEMTLYLVKGIKGE